MATTAAADRRDPTAPRRPFRASVDFADVVDQEIWQGDARDLSVSGMSVRSALVPEIGEQLACRFHLEGGRQVESRAEVVWTKDGGARDGAFGVRFMSLDDTTRGALLEAIPAPAAPAAPPVAAAPAGAAIAENSKVRIVIPGMEAPLRARVRTRVQDALIVGSDLTFLKIGEKVTVDGGADKLGGSITAVDIEVDGRSGVPRLILTIDEGAKEPRRDPVPRPVAPAVDAKVVDEKADAQRDTKVDAKAEVKIDARPEAKAPAEPVRRPQRGAASATRVLSTSDGEDLPEDDEVDTRTWAQRALHAAKENGARLVAASGPALRDAASAVGGAIVAARARIKGAAAPHDEPEAKTGVGKYSLRPQHATQSDPGSAPRRNRRTMVLAGAAGVATLGIVVYAVAGGPKETTPRPQVTIAPEGINTEAPNGSDPLAVPTTDPATVATEPVPGAAQPEPRMVQGQGAGMSPDLRSAASSPSADVNGATAQVTGRAARVTAGLPAVVATPPARAAAVAARGRMVMGNPAVRAGTLVRLRMDGPISGLTGVGARGADIVIAIPGRRSLDMGAPIARLDNRIQTSRVMNRVAGAELTLHFRTAAPPFAARARGNVLELVLAATPGVRATARR